MHRLQAIMYGAKRLKHGYGSQSCSSWTQYHVMCPWLFDSARTSSSTFHTMFMKFVMSQLLLCTHFFLTDRFQFRHALVTRLVHSEQSWTTKVSITTDLTRKSNVQVCKEVQIHKIICTIQTVWLQTQPQDECTWHKLSLHCVTFKISAWVVMQLLCGILSIAQCLTR